VYVREEHVTVSPEATVSPLVMLISEADAATAQWMTTVPAEVSRVAVATAEALPVALVSEVIAFAVAVPEEDAAKAVALRGKVATAVPGAPTVPDSRSFKLPLAPISAVTASVAASLAAVECVTAIL
jgi:hypothetical protein